MTKGIRVALLSAAFVLGAMTAALAQDAPPELSPDDQEKIEAATVIAQQGAALKGEAEKLVAAAEEQGDEAKGKEAVAKLDEAIAAFEEAFTIYPDPAIQLLIGECYRLQGNAVRDFDKYRTAITHYKKYLEMAPEGAEAEAANNRITALTEGIKREEERLAKLEEEKRKKEEEERKKREEQERKKREELQKHEGMQISADGMVLTGVADDLTAVPRGFGGAIFHWGKFGLEAHLGFDFFFRLNQEKGLAARSLGLNLGTRIGFRDDRFTGPFVSAGGGFGLMIGSPSERLLQDDEATCMDNTGMPDCSFDLDKVISGRLGFGWGFEASKKTTVAIRVDAGYFLFSVDDQQKTLPMARFVERPVDLFTVMVGLEFMRWL